LRARFAVEGDVVDLGEGEAAAGEAPADRLRREPGPMLRAEEPFLLHGADDLAVDDEAGRRIGVVGVDAEDGGHRRSTLAEPASRL
jgi:hypothetical protein